MISEATKNTEDLMTERILKYKEQQGQHLDNALKKHFIAKTRQVIYDQQLKHIEIHRQKILKDEEQKMASKDEIVSLPVYQAITSQYAHWHDVQDIAESVRKQLIDYYKK